VILFSHSGTALWECNLDLDLLDLASRTALKLGFCSFPDIFIQPRTQVYKGSYKEYFLALYFDELTAKNHLAGQAH
jgi:hypothetical protein